jgi:hypothetical protein
MTRFEMWLVATVTGLVVSFVVIGYLAAEDPATFDWDAAVAAGIAYGTLALALVTWRLVASARQDAAGTLQLARLTEEEGRVRVTPFVYPWADPEWLGKTAGIGTTLPFRNGGQGVALNVTPHIYWASADAAVAPTTLAAGEATWMYSRDYIPSWEDTWGTVTYTDLLDRKWETRFKVEKKPDGQIQMFVCAYGLASSLPQQAYPAGWEMPNGLARICLPTARA